MRWMHTSVVALPSTIAGLSPLLLPERRTVRRERPLISYLSRALSFLREHISTGRGSARLPDPRIAHGIRAQESLVVALGHSRLGRRRTRRWRRVDGKLLRPSVVVSCHSIPPLVVQVAIPVHGLPGLLAIPVDVFPAGEIVSFSLRVLLPALLHPFEEGWSRAARA